MYWKEGYKGFHSDCALNHAGFRALALIPLWCRAMHPILNYVEFRTNHEPNIVHGVVDGEMHFQLVIIGKNEPLPGLKTRVSGLLT
jgi:hypothetical protein